MAKETTASSTKAATPQKSSGSKTGLIIGAVGAVAVLLLAAVVIFGTTETSGIESETGEVTIDGVSLPLMPQSAPQDTTANGLTPPDVAGSNFAGDTVTITNDGRAKGIVFVAHWCPHCQEEVPRVQEWIDGGGSVDGVDLYSVSTSVRSTQANYPPSDWLEQEGWTVPVILDDADGSAHLAYGGGGFPYWVFVHSDGTVALRTSGQLQTDQLVQILESLN
ncbi:MAG: TlpA family protein disulfide reductase [Actinomycetia bacterium]|nr:TlpA family protein disulfide reductase [Actinomycetes bacterium]